MSFRWTDTLTEPLASQLRSQDWNRVEEARKGGWLLLSQEGVGDVSWVHLDQSGETRQVISPFRDERLPQLPELTSEWLRLGLQIQMLAYRVGSRAIFRIEAPEGPRIHKIYRKDRSLLQRWTTLPSDATASWSVPCVLNWDDRRHHLTLEYRQGESLNQRWLRGEGEPADGDRVADLLAWIGSHTPKNPLPLHTPQDEIRILEERLQVFQRMLKNPSSRAPELTTRVAAVLADAPATTLGICHRDFHDKQVLISGDRGTLLDLDLAAQGPPALDVGNILAHLRLRSLKGAEIPWQEIAARIATPALSSGLADSLYRWTAATLMRLVLIYSRRRRGPDLLDELLSSTNQALERRGEWEGLL
ncbi:MAG: phosphotransferase [Planctomycetota bacterium]